ncbi:MAG: TIGR04053 family radical SAM/SPASM domain-containing protein [Gemmatimonadetes bacterium]|nr:TIGR04053 family radical SAM/SPASM domain-containing protein [Gemmatimonadota bacterium]
MRVDFSQAPFLVIWETTRACDLACRHCRAEAVPLRHPLELTTAEAKRLLEEVRRFGPIIFVFSGGDALKRPDMVELVSHATGLGLRVAMTPAATPLASRDLLTSLKAAGLARLAVSLDGSRPAIHDAFRRVPGSFDEALRVLREAREVGLSTQVNTVVGRHNVEDFEALSALMRRLGIVFWEVFFLVPTGRARGEDLPSAAEFEAVFHKMYDLAREVPFDIKATAAPQYSRVVLQRRVEERRLGYGCARPSALAKQGPVSAGDGIGRARGVNDGDGFLFVSHTGEIYPSGFLPVRAGNVRTDDLVEVYRGSALFCELRDRSRLKGKCGVCEFRNVCGGSRARAYAMTGDWLAAEPLCAYQPRRRRRVGRARPQPAPQPPAARRSTGAGGAGA